MAFEIFPCKVSKSHPNEQSNNIVEPQQSSHFVIWKVIDTPIQRRREGGTGWGHGPPPSPQKDFLRCKKNLKKKKKTSLFQNKLIGPDPFPKKILCFLLSLFWWVFITNAIEKSVVSLWVFVLSIEFQVWNHNDLSNFLLGLNLGKF